MGDRLGRGRADTCGGARRPAEPRPTHAPRPPQRRRRRPPAPRRTRPSPTPPSPAIVPGTRRPHDPDAGHRRARRPQGHPGPGHADRPARPPRFHNNWLLPLCAIISVFVLVLLLYAMVRFRRGANPTPSRNSHNTLIEVIWTLVPVLILVAIAIPSIRLLRHQYTPPPADVTVKVTGHQWYWRYEYPDNGVTLRQLHAEGSERPDAPGEPARPHRRRRPAAARGRRAAGDPAGQGGEVHRHRRRRHPQLRRARPSGSSRTPTPASSTRPGSRSTGRASISANARSCAARATASCRSRSRSCRRRSSRSGSPRRAATCRAPSRPPRRPRAAPRLHAAPPASRRRRRRQQPATNQAATAHRIKDRRA